MSAARAVDQLRALSDRIRLSRPAKAYFGDRCAIYNDGGATARTDKHDLTRSGLSARRPAIGMTRASRTLNRPEAVARACLGG